jgi:hypothetical protein
MAEHRKKILLAVNGTLMRGLELNQNMIEAGATFVYEARTAPVYRLWSIDDRYPGMIRVNEGGASIALELWEVDDVGLVRILAKEPPGLTIGHVLLDDGREVLGVLAEPYITADKNEITQYIGWRNYISSK